MNVHLDVLELIFAELDGPDLVAAALVSRAFLAGALPSLYAQIEYTFHHAKRDTTQLSPFATIAAHAHLVVHVKRIAVHAAPVFQPSAQHVHPAFLRDLAYTLQTASNLRSFICTVKILPSLLPPLLDMPRLAHLRIWASLGSRQIAVLQQRTALQSLALDFPSWNVIDILPKWSAGMQKTLAHLTLFMSQDIDNTMLNATLAQLPRLRGLHVINCPRISHITVLKALSLIPDLRELSFTIFPAQESVLPPLHFCIPPLTHLSIDIRASYPGLRSLVARIVSRLSPRDALAVCGGWIGEIRGSSEHTDTPPNPATPNPYGPAGGPGTGSAPNFHVWQNHLHLYGPPLGHGPGQGHGNGHTNDPPLLGPQNLHHGNPSQDQNPGTPPNQGNQLPPPNFIGLPFPFPLGNPNGDGDNDHPGAGPPDPPADLNPDPNLPSLISSIPTTLSILHLPQISPTALKEVVDRCQGIQLLGIVMGNAFATLASTKVSRRSDQLDSRIKSHPPKAVGVRPEVNALAGALSGARVLRELIIDASAADAGGSGPGADTQSGEPPMLFTPHAVRMLMRESSHLRRIVAEGRIWQSPTPIPLSSPPFPDCLPIELTLTKARRGPSTGNNPIHGSHGGGFGQVEASNDHWFWLAESASAGKMYSGR